MSEQLPEAQVPLNIYDLIALLKIIADFIERSDVQVNLLMDAAGPNKRYHPNRVIAQGMEAQSAGVAELASRLAKHLDTLHSSQPKPPKEMA